MNPWLGIDAGREGGERKIKEFDYDLKRAKKRAVRKRDTLDGVCWGRQTQLFRTRERTLKKDRAQWMLIRMGRGTSDKRGTWWSLIRLLYQRQYNASAISRPGTDIRGRSESGRFESSTESVLFQQSHMIHPKSMLQTCLSGSES
jgi:hypothetical protein